MLIATKLHDVVVYILGAGLVAGTAARISTSVVSYLELITFVGFVMSSKLLEKGTANDLGRVRLARGTLNNARCKIAVLHLQVLGIRVQSRRRISRQIVAIGD